MSNYYLDELEKIKYYKQLAVDRFLKQDMDADKEKIQQVLDELDLDVAIFSQSYISSGSTFDVNLMNEQKQDIYTDLSILYRVLYKLANERVEKARAKMRYAMDDLRMKAKEFQYLVDSQSISVYGKTIFSQANDFDQSYKNGQVIVNLGPLAVASGSYLVTMLACNEIEQGDITFLFQKDGEEDKAISTYDYGRQYLKVTGNYKLETKSYDNPGKELGTQLIDIKEELVETDGYNLFINQNQIQIQNLDTNEITYAVKEPEIYYQAAGYEQVSFYVYGATMIQFNLVGDIEYQNFSDNEIVTPAQRQKVVLRGDGFAFDIKTDGIIYADKIPVFQKNGQLMVVQPYTEVTDYTIEHIAYGEDVLFDNVQVVIDNAEDTFYDIQHIVIKQAQISELEDRE